LFIINYKLKGAEVKKKNMHKLPSLSNMLAAGMHFGHRTNRWHPKMKQYIFGEKNGIYIIDLSISLKKLNEAIDFLASLIENNKTILFVGTKDQVKEPLKDLAVSLNHPYVSGKWLGGCLTNFSVIKKSVKKYQELLEKRETGKLEKYTKKEKLHFDREIKRLSDRVGGLTNLNSLPDALFIWDIKEEKTAIAEARKKNIPIVAICDTNVNPDLVNYPIPANDDSTKTIKLILESLKDSLLKVKNKLK
jgi:small subunit ribosomal protein S2